MLLPTPPVPVLLHGLSKDDAWQFAHIILAWGAAESEIGDALAFVYDISDGAMADDLINILDGGKKITLLQRALERRDPKHVALPILRNIAKAHGMWAVDRNILAHGFGAVGDEGTFIFSAKPKDPLPIKLFPELLNKANWLYLACSEVRRIVSGNPSSDFPLPSMPS